jgi:hypothetical protein
MAIVFYNPYNVLAQQFKTGLDTIGAALPLPPPPPPVKPPIPPTVEELINQIVDYVILVYGAGSSNPVVELELSIVLSETINGYINSAAGSPVYYDTRQQEFIFQLVEGIKGLPMANIYGRIENIEENIATSGLSSELQAPLLMATAMGKAATNYWMSQNATSPWVPFLSEDANYLAFIVSATMEGTLIGAKLMTLKGTAIANVSKSGVNAISALASTLVISSGKVLYNWQPRVAEVK